MARVRIARELGGAFGLLARCQCLRLAEGLCSCGNRVAMALLALLTA